MKPHRRCQSFEGQNRCNGRCADRLDERLETVSAGQGRAFAVVKDRVCAMRLQDCRATSHATVAECAIFATSNSLKSQVVQNLKSPFSNIRAVTSKLCERSRPT